MSDKQPLVEAGKSFNPEAFASNLAKVMENGSKALSAYLKPRGTGEVQDQTAEDLAQVVKTFNSVFEYWLSDAQRTADLQQKFGKAYLDLWGNAARRLAGQTGLPHQPAAEEGAIAGVYRQRLNLASGRFAMIDNGLGFTLVPWRPEMDRHLGREINGGIAWTFSPKCGLGR